MALEPKLSKYSLSANEPRLIFRDLTGYYNAETNPGGYGGINPARESLAMVLVATYNAIAAPIILPFEDYEKILIPEPIVENPDGQEPMLELDEFGSPVEVTPPAFKVTPDSEPQLFVLPWPADGWFRITALYFNAAASPLSEAYSDNTVLYDIDTGTVVKKINGAFTLVPDDALENEALYLSECEDFAVPIQTLRKHDLAEACTNLLHHYLKNEECLELERAINKYNVHSIGLASAIWNYCSGKKYVAQECIEVLNKFLLQ